MDKFDGIKLKQVDAST